MGIALTLQQYLDDKHIDYDVLVHKRTHCSQDTVRASHVPGERLAKAVVLTREGGFVVAVVPACAKVRLDTIERLLRCPVGMATEDEIAEIFPDCAAGRGAAGAGGLRGRRLHRREPGRAAGRVSRGRRSSQPRAHLGRAVPRPHAGRAARAHRREPLTPRIQVVKSLRSSDPQASTPASDGSRFR